MTWTPEQVLALASIVFGFMGTALLAIGGWVVTTKLNKANTEKAKAETIAIYQKMLQESAEREEALTKRVNDVEQNLEKVQHALAEKIEENSNLQRQIAELKVQTDEQAQEITDLREEINTLRAKRKQ
jgi:septal ring factor EnvC (AmiA/AmiB activator)